MEATDLNEARIYVALMPSTTTAHCRANGWNFRTSTTWTAL